MTVGDKAEQVKGRVEEAVGSLTGDAELKQTGKADQARGAAKEKLGEVIDKVEEVLHKAVDAVHPKK